MSATITPIHHSVKKIRTMPTMTMIPPSVRPPAGLERRSGVAMGSLLGWLARLYRANLLAGRPRASVAIGSLALTPGQLSGARLLLSADASVLNGDRGAPGARPERAPRDRHRGTRISRIGAVSGPGSVPFRIMDSGGHP